MIFTARPFSHAIRLVMNIYTGQGNNIHIAKLNQAGWDFLNNNLIFLSFKSLIFLINLQIFNRFVSDCIVETRLCQIS